jgi:predicted nucleic acid-binding protein
VADYYFGSSGIVKRYVAEVGSAWVRSITTLKAGNDIHLCRITGVEVVSALVRHAPPISPAFLARAAADFQDDFHNQYQIVPVNGRLVARAMVLAARYRLRGYGAVQLAAALTVRIWLSRRAMPGPTLVSADADLKRAAIAEGCTVDDPLTHP